MHRSASESAEEKKGVIIEAEVRYVFRIPLVKIEFELIIEAEVRYVFRIPLVKIEFELIIEAEVRYVFRIPLVKIQENVRGGFAHRKALNKGSHDWRSSE